MLFADGSLPQFDAPGALELLRRHGLTIPFVGGSQRNVQNKPVSARRQAANDYPFKKRLAHFGQAVAREWTQRKLKIAEDSRGRNEERFRSLFEHAAVGMALLELDGRWGLVNEKFCDLLGFSRHEMLGRNAQEMTHTEDLNGDFAPSIQLLAGGVQSDVHDKRYLRRDGTYLWCRVTRSVARSESGKPKYFIALVEELGEQKPTEEALRESIAKLKESLDRSESMSMLGALVSGVAHEVRNPLFGISSTLDAFEACSADKTFDQRFLVVLRKEVNRLNDLMTDLLDFGHPHNRELQLGPIADAIASALYASSPLARRKQVEIHSRVHSGLPDIRLDPERLPQVFLNLLENAIQHSPCGARVTLEAEEVVEDNCRWIVCKIKDSGPGFDPLDLPRLFEPFFTRRTGGTGLGLSIVQKIVEEHQGSISACNSRDGGALMSVRLPIGDKE